MKVLIVLLLLVLPAGSQNHKTWMDYGGGLDSSHYVALTQINKSNVSQLKIAWIYPTGDDRSYLFNPIIVDNVMYVLARNSFSGGARRRHGKEIWIHENLPGLSTRGITYWESKDRKDRRLIFTMNNFLQQIDARTGKSILTFGKERTRRSSGGPGPRSQSDRADSVRESGTRFREPHPAGLCDRRRLSLATRRYPRL